MNTSYRMYTPDDIDNLVQFWKENSGWDQIDRKEWERRFYSTPFGQAAIVLAEDALDGKLIAQFLFIPSLVQVDGRDVKGYRPFAPVVKESVRTEQGFMVVADIIMNMYNFATTEFTAEGAGLIHMLPDPRWARAFQLMPHIQAGSFPLWSLPLPLQQPYELQGYKVEPILPSDSRIDVLWQKASKLYGCGLARDSRILPWKTSHGNYQLIGVFKNDELIGMAASIIKANDRQWLICDMITADGQESLQATLKAACNEARAFTAAHEEASIHKIAILATNLIQPIAEQLGFQEDNYRFPIVVQVLDATLSREQVAPERWYASAND